MRRALRLRRSVTRTITTASLLGATLGGILGGSSPSAAHAQAAEETVRIHRDALGIGHVYADSDDAVAYGLGRLHFRDRPVRTMMNLTSAAGLLLETVGQRTPSAPLAGDPHFAQDARALRHARRTRANALMERYAASGATAEERAIFRLVTAFVRGVNDERTARAPGLADYFEHHASSLTPANRLTRAQYDALFARTVRPWEVFALGFVIVGSQWDTILETHGGNAAAAAPRWMPAGSNAFAVPPGGSATGHTYLCSDSHQSHRWYLSLRFKARHGTLDGGGFTVAGYPLLLMGFGRQVAWTMVLSGSTGSFDLDVFDGDDGTAPGTWIDEAGTTRPILDVTEALHYRAAPGSPLLTTLVTHRFLDAARSRVVQAVHPGRGEHPSRIYASRTTLGDPTPPSPGDPGHETEKMFYRFLVAPDADTAVQSGLDGTLSATGIYLTFADNARAITVQGERAPIRRNETPFERTWRNARQPAQRSGQGQTWTSVGGRTLHGIASYPQIRSDGITPVRNGKPLKFWANCNASLLWLLGLEQPLGQAGPEVDQPYEDADPDYTTPFDATTLALPTGPRRAYHLGPPWGVLTIRQEWISSRLKAAWAARRPNGIAEADLRALMTDHRSPLPIHLERVGFFTALESIAPDAGTRALAARMRTWAQRGAPYSVTSPADAADAARFHVFWWFMRKDAPGPWSRTWRQPFAWNFPLPTVDPLLASAAADALAKANATFQLHSSLDLTTMKRYAIPFGGPDVAVPGSEDSGHVTGFTWATIPGGVAAPRIDGGGGGRMPMLIRMRTGNEAHHAVALMTPALPGRVRTLPEWNAARGPAFDAAPLAWAQAQLYDLPMTEAALAALGYDASVTHTVYYVR